MLVNLVLLINVLTVVMLLEVIAINPHTHRAHTFGTRAATLGVAVCAVFLPLIFNVAIPSLASAMFSSAMAYCLLKFTTQQHSESFTRGGL